MENAQNFLAAHFCKKTIVFIFINIFSFCHNLNDFLSFYNVSIWKMHRIFLRNFFVEIIFFISMNLFLFLIFMILLFTFMILISYFMNICFLFVITWSISYHFMMSSNEICTEFSCGTFLSKLCFVFSLFYCFYFFIFYFHVFIFYFHDFIS